MTRDNIDIIKGREVGDMWEFDVATETWSCLSVSSVSTNDAEISKHLKGRLELYVPVSVSMSHFFVSAPVGLEGGILFHHSHWRHYSQFGRILLLSHLYCF